MDRITRFEFTEWALEKIAKVKSPTVIVDLQEAASEIHDAVVVQTGRAANPLALEFDTIINALEKKFYELRPDHRPY